MDLDLDNKLVEVQKINSDEDPNSPTATSERFYVPYDKLVVAVGANSISHGVEGLEHTVKLKTIRDAVNIRRKIMNNVEMASLPTVSPEERKKLLSFVVCGGGPTGTEFAAELSDWIEEDFVKWVKYKDKKESRLSPFLTFFFFFFDTLVPEIHA
jgi:NADH dehydrogenase